jgi:hypothetical protein
MVIAALLCCCLFLLACGTGRLPRARVMNASPDSPHLDVFIGGVRTASNLAFAGASGYHRINDGFDGVLVFSADSNDLLLEGVPFFAERRDYTLVVLDFLQFLNAILLTDDNSPPATNAFKLRFVNTSPTAGPVDMYLSAPGVDLTSVAAAFSNVEFGGFAGYASPPQGAIQLRVTPAGSKAVLADSGLLTLTAGQIRTAVLVNPPGTATQPLAIALLRDAQ